MRSSRESAIFTEGDTLKEKLLEKHNFEATNAVIDVTEFVEVNEKMFLKLLKDMNDKKIMEHRPQIGSQHTSKSKSFADQFQNLTYENERLRQQIILTKEKQMQKELKEKPTLKEKQQQIIRKSTELSQLKAEKVQIENAIENGDMLEMYEEKCRECEKMRKMNNQLSEEIKKVILDLNKVTGNDENPNMFVKSLLS